MGGSEQYFEAAMAPHDGGGCERVLALVRAFVERASARRKVLESLLFWRDGEADGFFEIFDYDSCPPFTFISHRWASDGQALGLHGELLFVLAEAPQEYIWLDCACAPQDQASFDNGNCLKIIWNVDALLARATDMVCYYGIDGLALQPRNDLTNMWDRSDSGRTNLLDPSDGVYLLFELESRGSRHEPCPDLSLYVDEGRKRSNNGGRRLWCVFEQMYGQAKIPAPTILPHDVEARGRRRSPMSPQVYMMREAEAAHARSWLSLSCFAPGDLQPLTTIMFLDGKLPAIFDAQSAFVVDAQTGDALPNAVMLPVLTADGALEPSHGWYTAGCMRCAFFVLDWPQNPQQPRIAVHAHFECLLAAGGDAVYTPRALSLPRDSWGRYGIVRKPCIFGDKCVAQSESFF